MIKVSIDVNAGDDRSRVSVRAQSIRRALEIAGEKNPGCALGVVFPLDPESFFVREPAGGTTAEVLEEAA